MKLITEGMQDRFRYDNSSIGFALRAYRLRMRAEETHSLVRRALLTMMSESYMAAGLALEHRLAGHVQTALELERMADDRLNAARRYFCGTVST